MNAIPSPRSRAWRREAPARSRHGQPEGRGRQDDDRHQSRHGACGYRRAGADHRSRSSGQRLDRPRHRAQIPRHLELRHAGRRTVPARRHHADGGAAPIHRALDHGSARRRTRNRRPRGSLLQAAQRASDLLRRRAPTIRIPSPMSLSIARLRSIFSPSTRSPPPTPSSCRCNANSSPSKDCRNS